MWQLFLRRFSAATIDILVAFMVSIILYFWFDIKQMFNVELFELLCIIYSLDTVFEHFIAKGKTLGEIFTRIKLIKQSGDKANSTTVLIRRIIFIIILINVKISPSTGPFILILIVLPFHKGINAIDLLFKMKYIDDLETVDGSYR